jgi:hypothetical protein
MNLKPQIDKKSKVDLKLKVIKREEVVEDFIRNFFTMYNLNKTLDEFIVRNKKYMTCKFQYIFIYLFIFLNRLFIFRKNLMNFQKKENLMITTSDLSQMFILKMLN